MTLDQDRHFEDNLKALGTRAGVPNGVAPDVRDRCLDTLGSAEPRRARVRAFRKRAWWSTVGLAAVLALAAIPFLGNGMPKVQAATVLTKLSEQIEDSSVFHVSLDNLTVEDQVWVDGKVQISDKALAGDLAVKVTDEPGKTIEANVALAIHDGGGWVLVRSIKLPDTETQALVDLVFPPGTETLLVLPEDVIDQVMQNNIGGELSEVRGMATGEIVAIIKQILASNEDLGITTTNQPDGTIRLVFPVRNSESLRNLIATVASSMGKQVNKADLDLSDKDLSDLVGATFSVVYDPQAEAVRSFSVSDIADMHGTVTVSLLGGSIDPALLDKSRVIGANTRVLDLTALQGLVEGILHKARQ